MSRPGQARLGQASVGIDLEVRGEAAGGPAGSAVSQLTPSSSPSQRDGGDRGAGSHRLADLHGIVHCLCLLTNCN